MNQCIEITIDAQGQATVETKGFAGSECLKASQFIEQALGQQARMQTTPEFFHVQATQQQQASNDL